METTWIVVIILAVLGVSVFLYLRRSGEDSRVRSLRANCRRSLKMPKKEADKTIDRYLMVLQEKHPNRSEEWYLDKFLYDLERDRG